MSAPRQAASTTNPIMISSPIHIISSVSFPVPVDLSPRMKFVSPFKYERTKVVTLSNRPHSGCGLFHIR